ncbi:hypothetical protein HRbin28_02743 [bacterium HR28]|nr:hypothetical protein HRbin28_02743 [bacterium HR28]
MWGLVVEALGVVLLAVLLWVLWDVRALLRYVAYVLAAFEMVVPVDRDVADNVVPLDRR